MFVADKAYEVTVDSNGKRGVKIPVSEFGYGANLVTAQAKKGDKGNEIVELVTLRVVEGKTIDEMTPKSWFMNWDVYHTLVTVGLLLLLALLLEMIGYRHHKKRQTGFSSSVWEKKETEEK